MAEISDLDLAVATLLVKGPRYDRLFSYYEGRQPLVYSHDRLRDIFTKFDARFTQNWCAVVIDAVHERIQLQRITVADNPTATDQLADLLTSSELLLEADDAHLTALVAGESYVIVWPDEDTGQPEAYCHDPRMVHVFYEAAKPRRKRFAVKWWIGDDGHRYLTLYYVDRLEYYRSSNQVQSMGSSTPSHREVTNGKAFVEYEAPAQNPYETIPVFHFRGARNRPVSELQNIVEPQDAVNKLLADMMIAAEFGAFPQRYIIAQGEPGKFRNAPNMIWDIPASDGEGQSTSVGQFDAAPLSNYLEAVDKWTTSIAIISRTPKHYFFAQGGDPSGEALIAMEAPLNHKAQKHISRFTATWSEIGQFMMRLAGMGEVNDNAIVPIFDKPETVQPYTQSLIRKESVAAGIPLLWQMKQEGYTEQELDELEQARTEQQQQQENVGEHLLREFGAGRGNGQNAFNPQGNGNGAKRAKSSS